jgi:DNA-binding NtrC family response regulator
MPETLLIVDDEPFTQQFLSMVLAPLGFEVLVANHTAGAEAILAQREVALLFLDIKMPGEDGLSFLKRWGEVPLCGARPEVVMITGHGSVASAVEAMKLGAADYMEKPFDSPEAVALVVERVMVKRRLSQENRRLREQLRDRFGDMVGTSAPMRLLYQVIERVSPLPITVLIRGESGTGKELVARSVHARSDRASRPMMALNCAAIPEGLLESTLFGHEKGAFTGADRARAGYFEEAQGGTLFLDEIGDMSMTLQARLLRVLQEKTFTRVGGVRPMEADVRIIAATHRDLPAMVREGSFREDLYYRLKVVELHVPPLRARGPEDLRLLAAAFLERTAARFGRPNAALTPALLRALEVHDWPGNVRELEHTITRMVALAPSDALGPEDLPPDFPTRARPPAVTPAGGLPALAPDLSHPLEEARAQFEEDYLRAVLQQTEGNISRAAEIAGIARQHLHRKLKLYGIDTNNYKTQ